MAHSEANASRECNSRCPESVKRKTPAYPEGPLNGGLFCLFFMTYSDKQFWDRVDKTGSCWVWTTGFINPDGYGQIRLAKNMTTYAHRLSWVLTHGDIPDKLWVLHKCDNPPCVRPDHLYLGTPKDNTQDAVRRCRMASRERHGRAKLRETDVKQIRLLSNEGLTEREIAPLFKIGRSQVGRILRGENW